ncbi:MAG: DNA polymerase ligase N-terminal domain-containing protein [Candidatus Babeliales bacterium]
MWCIVVALMCFAGEGAVMAKKRSLREYHKKRDFAVSPEPKGKVTSKRKSPIFVIQKHDATSLHYDVRLEIDGVLVSWAVPKGPSLNPAIKHLAVMTEDHPMDYADFEGVIPKGEYGAGPVMVWDTGTYTNIKTKNGKLVPMHECLKQGHIEVFLEGSKINGAFSLVRTHYQDNPKNWLLIKMKDEFSSAKKNPVNTQNKSVLTGRSMAQIKKAG